MKIVHSFYVGSNTSCKESFFYEFHYISDDMDALSKLEKDNEKLQDESEEDYEEEINDEESE